MSPNGSVAVPAFIGVLGPVDMPGGVVGKVGCKVQGMQDGETADDDRPDGVQPPR